MDSDRSPLYMLKKGDEHRVTADTTNACQSSALTSPPCVVFTLTVQPSITYGRTPLHSTPTNYLKFISKRCYKLETSNHSIIQCRGQRSLHHIPANKLSPKQKKQFALHLWFPNIAMTYIAAGHATT